MATKALYQVASWRSLRAAWSFLYRRARPKSRNTQGIDGLSINDFARDHKANLNRLSRDLLQGQFEFEKLRPHFVPKPNGNDRLICVPTVRDRIVQRALLDFLSAKYGKKLTNRVSYGFVKGRTVEQAATVACRLRRLHPWVFKTDITSFFDKVDRQLLSDRVKHTIRDSSLHALLLAAVACEVSTSHSGTAKKIRKLGIREGLGVRQGMPLSPFFANLLLQPLDMAIERAKLNAVRYADDLIFFGDSEQQCREIEAFCRQELKNLNLDIPLIGTGSKSVIFAPHDPAEFLGLGLCFQNGKYELKLLGPQIERIRMELLQLGSISELLSRKITLAFLGSTIRSRVAGYLSAYECCTNILELENTLGALQQMILRRVYTDGLKIDLATLSSEARTFLGLT